MSGRRNNNPNDRNRNADPMLGSDGDGDERDGGSHRQGSTAI